MTPSHCGGAKSQAWCEVNKTAMTIPYEKTSNEILNYPVDWSSLIGVETILTSTWVLDAGITLNSSSNTSTTTTAVISGGSQGTSYRVTNRITTSGSRTMERGFWLNVLRYKDLDGA
jgi:hypothetical protein